MAETAQIEFTSEEIQALLDNLDSFSEVEREEILKIASTLEERVDATLCQNDLIEFCKHMQPDYKVGKHHRILANLLMNIAAGDKDRVCVNMPPRHGKSQLVSIYFPAWFIGKYPNKKVLMVSHTADLAVDFGRKVRNIIDSDAYKKVFPTVTLAADSKSAGRWNTNFGGEYYATGVGSALAGRGADLLLVDDPHNEQDIINGNFGVFEKAYEWFTFGARTRLMPGGRIAIVQCMTGDTLVLMATGHEKPLREVRSGDLVSTFDNGALAFAEVTQHRSNGVDRIFAIKTTCGKVVRANKRHPFLVLSDGELRWVRLQHLNPGDFLVSLKAAPARGRLKHVHPCAAPVCQNSLTTSETRTPPSALKGIGVNTLIKRAVLKVAQKLRTQKDFAKLTTTGVAGLKALIAEAQSKIVRRISSIGTALRWTSTTPCLFDRTAFVPFANNPQPQKTPAPIGMASCALTTATAETASGRFYVMTATSQSDTPKPLKLPSPLLNTCSFTTTQIRTIEYAGTEEVFDVQIDRTENFIAHGLVSHNTRWHQDDLTGRVTRDMATNDDADQYEVVEFPAIFESTVDGKTVEKPLWPEFFDLKALHRTKASMPLFQWNAQFQQNPTAQEAAVIKREWWREWKGEDPPPCEYIIMSLDAAAEINTRSDFTAITTWGVFLNENSDRYEIILLNAIKRRMEFPELKQCAMEQWQEWSPDAFIVEKKSSGTPLYQELRRAGIPVQDYTPHRGTGDKLARLNSVADIVMSGLCWVPQTRWAEEVVEEIAGFPFMSHDDLVDSTVMALLRFRQGGFIRLPSDEKDEPRFFRSHRRAAYY